MKNLDRFGLKIEMCPICMKFGTQNKSNMLIVNILRYYATFKVRKFEWLFYKINTCLQKTTTCIGLRAEQIFSEPFCLVTLVATDMDFYCFLKAA